LRDREVKPRMAAASIAISPDSRDPTTKALGVGFSSHTPVRRNDAQKNRAGKTGTFKIRGLNRTRNSMGPADQTPGGWGAEESGTQTGPGLEATIIFSHPSMSGD
ncbi:MAG: hypothetical protein ACREE3_07330, partial [Stellaceae bacterium]